MEKVSFQLKNVKCSGCVNRIKTEMMNHAGIEGLNISLERSTVEIDFDQQQISVAQLSEILNKLGYPVCE